MPAAATGKSCIGPPPFFPCNLLGASRDRRPPSRTFRYSTLLNIEPAHSSFRSFISPRTLSMHRPCPTRAARPSLSGNGNQSRKKKKKGQSSRPLPPFLSVPLTDCLRGETGPPPRPAGPAAAIARAPMVPKLGHAVFSPSLFGSLFPSCPFLLFTLLFLWDG